MLAHDAQVFAKEGTAKYLDSMNQQLVDSLAIPENEEFQLAEHLEVAEIAATRFDAFIANIEDPSYVGIFKINNNQKEHGKGQARGAEPAVPEEVLSDDALERDLEILMHPRGASGVPEPVE